MTLRWQVMVRFSVVNTRTVSEKIKPLYDSSKRVSPAIAELKEIGNYRHLLAQLIRRDILTRYKRSFLGVAWTMLNPLGTMLVMTIVFRTSSGRACLGCLSRFIF